MTLGELDKTATLGRLIAMLERDLAIATAAQRATMEGATHEESRPENDKDTRAVESSYLARGQASRVLELTSARALLDALEPRRFGPTTPIAVAAFVALEGGREPELYCLLPAAGGLRLPTPAGELRIVTPASPLGRALLGKLQGDEVEVQVPGGRREYLISLVA